MLAWTVQHPAGASVGHGAVLEDDLAIHDYLREAFGVLMWILERCFVMYGRRVEDCNVRLHAFAEDATIVKIQTLGWK